VACSSYVTLFRGVQALPYACQALVQRLSSACWCTAFVWHNSVTVILLRLPHAYQTPRRWWWWWCCCCCCNPRVTCW
jgi:hypothetical protein